jgi:hypothetical protein
VKATTSGRSTPSTPYPRKPRSTASPRRSQGTTTVRELTAVPSRTTTASGAPAVKPASWKKFTKKSNVSSPSASSWKAVVSAPLASSKEREGGSGSPGSGGSGSGSGPVGSPSPPPQAASGMPKKAAPAVRRTTARASRRVRVSPRVPVSSSKRRKSIVPPLGASPYPLPSPIHGGGREPAESPPASGACSTSRWLYPPGSVTSLSSTSPLPRFGTARCQTKG